MKYLSFREKGFHKKFPLNKTSLTAGRNQENDLIIDDTYISRIHAKIKVKKKCINVKDLDSANGTFYKGEKVREKDISLGDSFVLGRTEFTLHEGSPDLFKVTEKYIPVFTEEGQQKISKGIPPPPVQEITDSTRNALFQVLDDVLHIGYQKEDFFQFTTFLSKRLSSLENFGSLFISSREKGKIHLILAIKNHTQAMEVFKYITAQYVDIFSKPYPFSPIAFPSFGTIHFYNFPLSLAEGKASLIYLPPLNRQFEDASMGKFLHSLTMQVELMAHMYRERSIESRGAERVPHAGSISGGSPVTGGEPRATDIVAANLEMKQLIQQAIKIAASDIFVLIQGESGTGKELFARLIHSHSQRRENQFVALNCAAIPESLLESELFGHEKGAFTGAYSRHQGKLELASGGTLVLDEIGDMPLMLQAKLLRALQESEFYRLGGSAPIKVDLRLITLTHQNLEALIQEKKFREDLYFRLVHRTLNIPPLRERPEDIPLLINHFSNQYCSILKKSIRGYSVKAYDALQNHHWRGNVRQLENEIKSLINLTDAGEIIDFDLLSKAIRDTYQDDREEYESTDPGLWTPLDQQAIDTSKLPTFKFYARPDKETIIKFLEMNSWNKSKTAEALNMTYQGLHKRMNQLGIVKKSKG